MAVTATAAEQGEQERQAPTEIFNFIDRKCEKMHTQVDWQEFSGKCNYERFAQRKIYHKMKRSMQEEWTYDG